MRENRAAIAALVVGLLIGALVGLAIGARLQITSDQWWALAGSAVGAVLAIFGAILVFHYQSRETERADRRRIAQQIDAAMRHVHAFDEAASHSVPRSTVMQSEMRLLTQEYEIVRRSVEKYKHTCSEIARASRHLGTGVPDRVNVTAFSAGKSDWNAEAVEAVEHVRKSLDAARKELRV